MEKIAVLLTCHNRKEKTISCLKSFYSAIELSSYETKFDIYLVDDGSIDGTSEEIIKSYPEVNLIKGSGYLYWAGGMRLAWKTALNKDQNYDYFLLLNDDIVLFRDAIKKILNHSFNFHVENSNYAVLIGSTKDIKTNSISYGGRKLYSKYRSKSYLIHSETEWVECDLGEANIMLIPKIIVQKIGIFSDKFVHGMADYDYTIRVKKEGFKVIIIPGIFGTCTFDHGKSWLSANTKLAERIKYLYSPKGLSYKEYLYYIRKHFPLQLPDAFVKLWLKTLFPIVYDIFKK